MEGFSVAGAVHGADGFHQAIPSGNPVAYATDFCSGDRPPEVLYRAACGGCLKPSKSFSRHQWAHVVDPAHIAEAVATLWLPRRQILQVSVDLGRAVGMDHRVTREKVGMRDPILAARRRGRDIPSRVAVDAAPSPTSRLTLVATRNQDRELVLVTAYYGRTAPPEPLGHVCARHPSEMERALDFWMREALIWDAAGYAEEPFATTWERMLSGRWVEDAPARPRKARPPEVASGGGIATQFRT